METTYREWEKKRQNREQSRRPQSEGQAKQKKVTLGAVERRRLGQLLVCLALFLVVFVGKGIFPDKMVAVREQVLETIHADTDFKEAFATLGVAISSGEPMEETVAVFFDYILGGGTEHLGEAVLVNTLYEEQLDYLLTEKSGEMVMLVGCFDQEIPIAEPIQEVVAEVTVTETVEEVATMEEAVETVLYMDYAGETLPDNATMDQYLLEPLAVGETVAPVMATMSSAYGWRIHPVEGEEKFHYGIDLAVDTGTPIVAFADGVVDYIGENEDEYGLYLQITHEGGLTTFYAHCSEFLVVPGQTVSAGETIALSGATGNVTGPHLHFEMRLNGTYLNPAYYIETT